VSVQYQTGTMVGSERLHERLVVVRRALEEVERRLLQVERDRMSPGSIAQAVGRGELGLLEPSRGAQRELGRESAVEPRLLCEAWKNATES
jgi:hypothetical protein